MVQQKTKVLVSVIMLNYPVAKKGKQDLRRTGLCYTLRNSVYHVGTGKEAANQETGA